MDNDETMVKMVEDSMCSYFFLGSTIKSKEGANVIVHAKGSTGGHDSCVHETQTVVKISLL